MLEIQEPAEWIRMSWEMTLRLYSITTAASPVYSFSDIGFWISKCQGAYKAQSKHRQMVKLGPVLRKPASLIYKEAHIRSRECVYYGDDISTICAWCASVLYSVSSASHECSRFR